MPIPRNLEVEWASLVDTDKIFKDTGLIIHFTDHPPDPDIVLTQLCPNVRASVVYLGLGRHISYHICNRSAAIAHMNWLYAFGGRGFGPLSLCQHG